MRPHLFSGLITVEDALRRSLDAARPITRVERVALADASGRVAAEDVHATADVPAFDRAAMDGYALRSADVATATPAAPVTLTCVDQIFTGRVPTRTVGPGECAEIGTGAPLPDGADAVVMVERTSHAGGQVVLIKEATRPRQNVGARGADITAGHAAIRRGDPIGPARTGALAAIGETSVLVYARPTLAAFATGHEVVPGGHPLPPGHVYDVNSVTLDAMARQHGATPLRMPPVRDDVDSLVATLVEASAQDVIVTSGGSSVGGRDLLIDALERCGSIEFHGIAVKPGKPTLFGHVGTTPIFGMPGNPTSCLSNAYILLVPFLRRLARLPPSQPVRRTLPLARAVPALADRHQFYTVRIAADGRAEPAFKSSGDITSMAAADGYIEVPAGSRGLDAGDGVVVTMF